MAVGGRAHEAQPAPSSCAPHIATASISRPQNRLHPTMKPSGWPERARVGAIAVATSAAIHAGTCHHGPHSAPLTNVPPSAPPAAASWTQPGGHLASNWLTGLDETGRGQGDTQYGLRQIAEPLGFLLAFRHETPLRGAPERLPV